MSVASRTTVFRLVMGLAILFAIPKMHLLLRGPDAFLLPQYLTQYAIALLCLATYFGLTYVLKLRNLGPKLLVGPLLSVGYWVVIVQLETMRDPNYGGLVVLLAPLFIPLWLLLITLGHFKEKNAAFVLLFLLLAGSFLFHQQNLLGY